MCSSLKLLVIKTVYLNEIYVLRYASVYFKFTLFKNYILFQFQVRQVLYLADMNQFKLARKLLLNLLYSWLIQRRCQF
jgi:hypothetical protein